MANPTVPYEIGSCATPTPAMGIDVQDDYAYLAIADSGLRIIDISDPSAPAVVGAYDSILCVQVDVVGDYAYCATAAGKFYVLNVSDPANTYAEDSIITGSGWSCDVHVVNNFAYLAWTDLAIVDVTDPTNPFMVDQISAPGVGYGIFMEDSFAYLVTTLGLFVYNVADTGNIVQVGYHETPGSGQKVFVSDCNAYVADQYDFSKGQIIDCTGTL